MNIHVSGVVLPRLHSSFIKRGPLKQDPQNPDPGHVTLCRLNRAEYHKLTTSQ